MSAELPSLPFAVFDEFGKGADDRVQDYGRQCARSAIAAQAAEVDALRADAGLLQWILAHPETAAEELEDACAFVLDPRTCLKRRRAGIAEAAARAALKEPGA